MPLFLPNAAAGWWKFANVKGFATARGSTSISGAHGEVCDKLAQALLLLILSPALRVLSIWEHSFTDETDTGFCGRRLCGARRHLLCLDARARRPARDLGQALRHPAVRGKHR